MEKKFCSTMEESIEHGSKIGDLDFVPNHRFGDCSGNLKLAFFFAPGPLTFLFPHVTQYFGGRGPGD